MPVKPLLLFLTLKTFSATGGIEKVCRIAGKALFEICEVCEMDLCMYSLYDNTEDGKCNKYFPLSIFRGFHNRLIPFTIQSFKALLRRDKVIILSHVNLLPVGYILKSFFPSSKLILFAHGIEIWPPISLAKTFMLKKCDLVLAVSNYTAQQISGINAIKFEKISVLNNCIDPFLPPVGSKDKLLLRSKYGISEEKVVMLAVTRYSNHEQYKGYDRVLEAMNLLKVRQPNLYYLLVGKYDNEEKARLDKMIGELELENRVKFAGFVIEEELPDYFRMADMFVMPSRGEGFGIVFIEALHYGLPVIAGNQDGTTDALSNGALGCLIDPNDSKAIAETIYMMSNHPTSFIPDSNLLREKFTFEVYKKNLEKILFSLPNLRTCYYKRIKDV